MSLNTDDLVIFSDILTGATSAGFSSVFDKPTLQKSVEAVVISILARLLSRTFPGVTGGTSLTAGQKDELTVGLLSAVNAYAQKRSVSRAVVTGIASDLIAEMTLKYLNINDKVLLGGTATTATSGGAPPQNFNTSGSHPTG
jgi:hypothetical protein